VFRDVTGESPTALRARQQAEPGDLTSAPPCYLIAAHRPHLTIAVSEKRRRDAAGNKEGQDDAAEDREVS
jgi:hypothetical protein